MLCTRVHNREEEKVIESIPDSEFKQRHARVQGEVNKSGLDVLIVHSDEADFANVRYLSDYWPIFECAGALIPKEGDLILLIGPESETYARDRSKIKEIRKILQYRESAEPDYPNIKLDTFEAIFSQINNGKPVKRLGIGGWQVMPVAVYEAIKKALPDTEIVKADNILANLRMIKSENEIAIMRQAYKIAEHGVQQVLAKIKPGMTELQVVGIAQEAIYSKGAEYEGYPVYLFAGKSTNNAISRPTRRKINKGEMIQIGVGAKVCGYCSTISIPVCIGKMPPEMRRLTEVGLEAHKKTMEFMRAGVAAKEVVINFNKFVESKGCSENLLYGPCHGTGMMEVEIPWVEETSEYLLQENMTFAVDTFLYTQNYGLRWERGARVTKDGVEELSKKYKEIMEL